MALDCWQQMSLYDVYLCISVDCAFYKVQTTNSFVEYNAFPDHLAVWMFHHTDQTLLTELFTGMTPHVQLAIDPCRLNLDSTESITLSQCTSEHLACFSTHYSWCSSSCRTAACGGPSCSQSVTEQASVGSSGTDLHIRRVIPCTYQVCLWCSSVF